MMKEVKLSVVDGQYRALFPDKCVYCGAPKEVEMRVTASRTKSYGRRKAYHSASFQVPYCAQHARESKRNARVLTVGLVTVLLTSCCVLFGVTTSINRNPATTLLILLALIAFGLAFAGRELLRKVMSRSIETMADMPEGKNLGLKVKLYSDEVVFSFTNDHIADEFARLNGQMVSE